MNNLTVSGFVTKKGVEMKDYEGTIYASFNLNAKSGDGRKRILVSCALWGKRSGVIEQYVIGGDRLVVQGKIKNIRMLPSKDDGEEMPVIDLSVDDFELPAKENPARKTEQDDEDF